MRLAAAAAMTCGSGNDRLDTDLADDDSRALPTGCVPARVVSIETGSHGPKATIRPMLLR